MANPRFAMGLLRIRSRTPVGSLARANSSMPPPKPRVLEQPERFNPPSHPSRLPRKPKYYGPDLSQRERDAQKTRKYPHMMPPEGSFMHWFLTNRKIHLYISISTLVFLTCAIWYQDFIHNTPYLDLLPPNSMLFAHPITFFRRWGEVYLMHVQYVSRETAERRKQNVDDAQKRKEYRKAHGLNDPKNIFDRLAEEEEGDRRSEISASPRRSQDMDATVAATTISGATSAETSVQKEGEYIDFDGNLQPARKKLFGIW